MSKRIKVAFFAEILIENFDGASRTMFQLIKRIPTDQFEFIFFCGVAPLQSFPFKVIEVPTVKVPFNNTYKMALPILHQNRLKQHLSEFKPDIVHIATPSMLGNFALDYARSKDIPVISIYHTHFISYIDYYLEKASVLIQPAKNMLISQLRKFYNRCQKIYVPSSIMINELESMFIETNKMTLWPRGLNTDLFNPVKKEVDFIKQITKNEKPNILFASRLVWEKNLKTLIKIYNKALKNKIEYNFIIAGDGVAKNELMKLMPDAFFLGALSHDELSKVYASSDVYIFTSVTETYGNVVVEAMASGLPCVIANGGGSAEFIDHGINGFLCQPENEDEYLEKIQMVLSNEILRNQFIEKGLHFTKGLQWKKLADTYFDDLRVLANSKQEIMSLELAY